MCYEQNHHHSLKILATIAAVLLLALGKMSAESEPEMLCEESPLDLEQRFAQFHLAAEYGDVALLQKILPTLPRPLPERWSAEPFFAAIEARQGEAVEFLIKQGFEVNARHYNRTPLQTAVQTGDRAIVRLLLGAGADPAVGAGDPLLVQALLRGHPGIEQDLLAASKEEPPVPPLHFAAATGELTELHRLLAAAPGQVDEPWGPRRVTPLELAARNGQQATVQALLAAGARPAGAAGAPQPPVSLAARHGHAAVVESLLETGAEPEIDLFHVARSAGPEHLPVLRVLREQGWDLQEDPEFAVQLLNAAIGEGELETARALLDWGTPMDRPDSRGVFPLEAAVLAGNSAAFALLEDRLPGDLQKMQGDQVYPALFRLYSEIISPIRRHHLAFENLPEPLQEEMEARSQDRIALLESLTERKPDITRASSGPDGVPLLWSAIAGGFLPDAHWLLEHGALPNAAPREQPTSLSLALTLPNGPQKTRLIHALLDAGASPDGAPHDNPQTPLYVALTHNCPGAARLLLEKGATPRFTEPQLAEIHLRAQGNPQIAEVLEEMDPEVISAGGHRSPE